MPGKRIDLKLIQLVYYHYYKGKSLKELSEMFSLQLRTMYNIINRAEKEDRLELRKPTGRKQTLTRRAERKILRTIEETPQTSTRKLAEDMKNECGLSVSHENACIRTNTLHK